MPSAKDTKLGAAWATTGVIVAAVARANAAVPTWNFVDIAENLPAWTAVLI